MVTFNLENMAESLRDKTRQTFCNRESKNAVLLFDVNFNFAVSFQALLLTSSGGVTSWFFSAFLCTTELPLIADFFSYLFSRFEFYEP